MKHKTLKSIITMNTPRQTFRPAEAFWDECRQQAQEKCETNNISFPHTPRRKISGFYPALASLASAAALVILYFSLLAPTETHRALNSFRFGESLNHNGAVVLTDKTTDATILWIMTDDTEEDPL